MRLDLIIRTSRRKKDAQSPAQQRQVAEGICRAGDHEIVKTHDSGRSESGKTMERRSLAEYRKRHAAGETDGIVVAYLDRLGRAPIEESVTFVRELVKDGGALVAADWGPEPIELSDPNVETMLVFRLQMNRDLWSKARARYALSQRNALEMGRFVGPTPFGYLRAKEGDEKGRLFEHPVLGPVVTEAYRRAARDGLHAAWDYLAAEAPERKWTTYTVRRLLASRAYLGEAWIWVPANERNPDGDKVRKTNPEAHEPLVDLATWTAAQTAPQGRRSNGDYVLSGFVSCGVCGGPVTGQFQAVHGRRYRRMRCSHLSIGADALEEYVRDRLGVALGARSSRLSDDPNGALEEAREANERANSELAAYLSNPALSAMGDAFVAGAEMRAAQVMETEQRYREEAGRARRSQVIPALTDLEDPEQFERALAAMVKAVWIRRGRGTVPERTTIVWTDESLNAETPFEESASEQTIEAGMQALAAGHRSDF